MKTTINVYIGLLLLMLSSSACTDDFLEEKRNFGEYDDTFYQSQERVDFYINNIYYDFFQSLSSPTATLVGLYETEYSGLTEEIGGIRTLIDPTQTLITSDDGFGYYGTKLENKLKNEPYHRIRDCNALLEDIDVKGANLDEDYRDRAKGQMYYFRALQYFDLMRSYGGVPIVTTVENASVTDESLQIPRASVTELVAQIVSDFDMAATLLPGTWEPGQYGRFTKGAALAQKAKVLLTYASPLYNADWDNNANERWQAALQAGLEAESQLASDGYGLYGNTAKDWEDLFLIDNTFSPEAITVHLLGNGNASNILNNSWERTIRLSSQDGNGGQAAPKEMIDLFPMADGSRPTAENGYDDFLFFVDRDPRFYRTFAFSGRKWAYDEDPDDTVWAYRYTDSEDNEFFSDNNQVSSPAFVRKMSNPLASNASSFEYSGTDIFEYRYAELLLNIAECYAATGDISNTISYLGRIRERVGINSSNNYGIGNLASKYEALEACLYERRIELAYEGKRFWDVQRWMLYDDDGSINSNNTCAMLGLEPLNGTQRTGNFLQYTGVSTGSEDPLAAERAVLSVDPDAADFQAQIQALAAFYTANFEFAELPIPLDNVNGEQAQIDFKPYYYIMGLKTDVLTQNPYLRQTVGWQDASGAPGTYIYQE